MNPAANEAYSENASAAEASPPLHVVDDAPPESFTEAAQVDEIWMPDVGGDAETSAEPAYRGVVGGFLVFLAIAWTGIVAWAAGQAMTAGAAGVPEFVRWAAVASGPLALIGLGWLMFGRSSRGETQRFVRAVQTMRDEAEALRSVLASVGQHLSANRAALADDTARLVHLGEEAAARLGAVTRDVDAGAQAMVRYADGLDRAAGSARTDMGVLLADIPRAEAQARAMAESLRAAGLEAQDQAARFEDQVGALATQVRGADEAARGAAGNLTAHIAQVESAATAATGDMERATASMAAGIDAAFDKATAALDATRQGIDEQSRAVLALVEQAAASLDLVGVDAARNVAARVSDVSERIDMLGGQLERETASSLTLIGGVDRALGDVETRFTGLSAEGGARMTIFASEIESLSALLDGVIATMDSGDARVGDLATRGEALKSLLEAIRGDLDHALPASLAEVEEGLARNRDASARLAPEVAEIAGSASVAQDRLREAGEAVGSQQAALDTLIGTIDGGLAGMHARVEELAGVIADADTRADRLARDSGPQLIDALLRVQDAANQAAERARDAIVRVIPEVADRMGDATVVAMNEAIATRVAEQMGEVGALAQGAVEAARGASERLTRQMVTIGETTAAVEARIADAQGSLRENESEQFSRRVAVLIESLNSTSIDVTKILSNDVTDNAWAQYLKGDRGVFTRRAVRLLDNGEAREIARHYEEEPEFREQVNRYVHDFEALLRRVLAERDGSPLGVTLLSSDVGKLYVALAQAIDRLRT